MNDQRMSEDWHSLGMSELRRSNRREKIVEVIYKGVVVVAIVESFFNLYRGWCL